jgi:hypothetical protein
MPANLPSAIVTGGGGDRRGAGETLLLGLAQQVLGGLAQAGMERVLPPQITPAQKVDFGIRERNTKVAERQISLQEQQQQDEIERATLRGAAVAGARKDLETIAGDNAPLLTTMYDFSVKAGELGMDSSTINGLLRSYLPPDQATALSMRETQLKIIDAKNSQDADRFATGELTRQGIIPQGVEIVPGAAKTLLSVLEGRAGKAIDWQKEAIDYVTSRIGESAGGTGGMTYVDGQLSSGTPPITVEQATAEWRDIVNRHAPAATRQRLLTELDSNAFQRRLALGMVTDEAAKIFMAGGTDELVRQNLAGAFTPEVINSIIKDARRVAPGLKP